MLRKNPGCVDRNLSDDPALSEGSGLFHLVVPKRTGTNHLYLYDLNGRLLHPLTAGAWNVDGLLAVDESAGLLYFDSNKDAVIDKQVYAVGLDGRDSANPHRISRGDGWHAAQFARDSRHVSLYVDTFSDPGTPPQVSINAPDGHRVAWIEANTLDATHPYWPYRARHVTPQYGSLRAEDGQDLQYSLMKPPDFDPARHYPVFLNVYGGPTVQNVTRTWPKMIDEYMAQQGYVVFTLDNRGTSRRSRAFSDPIHGHLGEVEVRDQLAGIRWLQCSIRGSMRFLSAFWRVRLELWRLYDADDARQGLRCDFAAGAAKWRPVTDWRLYDTCYTERLPRVLLGTTNRAMRSPRSSPPSAD